MDVLVKTRVGLLLCVVGGCVWFFVAFCFGFWNIEDFYLSVYKCRFRLKIVG